MDQATGEVHCAARSAERTGSVKIELPVAAGAVACRKTRASRAAAGADAGPALEASDVREPGGTGAGGKARSRRPARAALRRPPGGGGRGAEGIADARAAPARRRRRNAGRGGPGLSGGDSDARALMRSCLARVASGPAHSKDLTRAEARAAMRAILAGRVDPVQAGIFLIALRMKYETREENNGVLDALRDAALEATAAVDELLVIADPCDGYARTLPASPFLPAVLAACGVPALSEGVETMAPKHGLTHHQVLRAAGAAVDLRPSDAAERLEDPGIGWAYLDQSRSCPALHALAPLRDLIVKRPALSTVERTIGAVRARGSATDRRAGYDAQGGLVPARGSTHLVTGLRAPALPGDLQRSRAPRRFRLRPARAGRRRGGGARALPTGAGAPLPRRGGDHRDPGPAGAGRGTADPTRAALAALARRRAARRRRARGGGGGGRTRSARRGGRGRRATRSSTREHSTWRTCAGSSRRCRRRTGCAEPSTRGRHGRASWRACAPAPTRGRACPPRDRSGGSGPPASR